MEIFTDITLHNLTVNIFANKFVQMNIIRTYATNVNCRQNKTHAM